MNGALLSLLDEPALEFRYGQSSVDPRAGLGLFGPYDADLPSRPGNMVCGVVGRPVGIEAFKSFAEAMARPIISCKYGPPSEMHKERALWPPFPGYEAAFCANWCPAPAWSYALDEERIFRLLSDRDPHKRAYGVADEYLEAIRRGAERDDRLSVVVCVVPDDIWLYCRPRSRVSEGTGRRPTQAEVALRRVQGDMFGAYESEQYDLSVDFRRQLKARSMSYGLPIQLVRESTLRLRDSGELSERGLTRLSDRAWNLGTTIYYKAGGKPWRLNTARAGVCYVGLAFRRASEGGSSSRTACCAAQMFLDSGDGVVFRGEFGPWYSPESKEFHLDRRAAKQLLEGVLRSYREQGGSELKEVFLHSRSAISYEEFEGYAEASPAGAKIVGIRVKQERDRLRAFRPGKYPIMRGTMWRGSEGTAYLWTSGFKPSLLTYDGFETPVPLRIDIQHGEAEIAQVSTDILGLTKLNYNACKLGDANPVTIKFSDAVGEILVSNPNVKDCRPNFRYYI